MLDTQLQYDKKKIFDDYYNEAITSWTPAYIEMYKDLQMTLGDQWNSEDKDYLKEDGRNAFCFNYLQRNVHLNSGLQRKSRLGFGVDPQQQDDDEIADYLQDALIWQANKCKFYGKLSDGFEDASITGMTLVSYGLDFSSGLKDPKLICEIEQFQSVLLDPLFTKNDLSDCRFMLKRKYLPREVSKSLVDKKYWDKIDKLKGGRIDNRFDYMSLSRNQMEEQDIVAYDEMYERVSKKIYVLTNDVTGEETIWRAGKKKLDEYLEEAPYFTVNESHEQGIEYTVLIQGETILVGDDPLNINDYPSVVITWIYKPQYDDFSYKIQGMNRATRDPQIEYNRKRSKISDMIDRQASTGWVTEEGAVTNEEDLFKSGNGQVIKTAEGKLGALREKAPIDIPQGLVHLVQMLTTDLMQIPGFNEEALGVASGGNTEVSGTLAKQRAMSAISIFQNVYDKLNESQEYCGLKMLKIMLNNFSPEKWQLITGKSMPEGLNIEKVLEHDIVVKESQLTDSQKNLSFFQALEAKTAGIDIPQQFIIEEMPTANKTRLKELYQQESEAKQKQEQFSQQLQMAQLEATIKNLNANSFERETRGEANKGLEISREFEAQKDLEQSTLDKIKGIRELQGMNLDQIGQALGIIEQMKAQEIAQIDNMKNSDNETQQTNPMNALVPQTEGV